MPRRSSEAMSPFQRLGGDAGFTFVELMVTLAIMAVLATVAVPLTKVSAQRMREQELRTALREIRTAIDAYKRAADRGQVVVNIGESGYPPTLDVLVSGVADRKSPNGRTLYFLRRLPRDPMADQNDEGASSTWGLRSYQSEPDDPREGDDVFDIYSKSDKVGLNGVPYRQW